MISIDYSMPRAALVLALVLVPVYSCSSYQVETSEATSFSLNDDENIAVVGHSDIPEDILKCVSTSIQPTLPMIPSPEFRDALYPWFEPSTTPITQTEFEKLLEREQVVDELAALQVRYIVVVGGGTIVEGGGDCVGAMTGFVCAGSWDKSTHLVATVLDPHERSVIEAVNADVEGTSWFVLLAILPLGAPALTETIACDEVVQRLTKLFSQPIQSEN